MDEEFKLWLDKAKESLDDAICDGVMNKVLFGHLRIDHLQSYVLKSLTLVPVTIKYELMDLNSGNVKFAEYIDECSENSLSVCSSDNCDVQIIGDYNFGKVIRGSSEIYYTGNLLFGAVFSSPYIYECNVKRLANKFDELALIYKEKISRVEDKGCSSDIDVSLDLARSVEINSSKDLILLSEILKNINELNAGQEDGCEIW